ncbi:MAG: folate-binding protein YgfZ [bacterium]|nr:folate-binding protein YgfZ [bacterium]
MTKSYQALRESAAAIDLSGRGKILATGEDRVRLLHAMVTNHVEELTPGKGCYAFFLDAQGHILTDVNILCLPDALLLDTEPETRETLYQHLDRYIIADDVTLEDVTDTTATIGVEGPAAAEALEGLGAPIPAEPLNAEDWGDRRVLRASATGGSGLWIMLPTGGKQELLDRLGLPVASAADVHTVRLENGHPRYGEDLSTTSLPQETQLDHALHFAKGCYLGQEIVERIRSRGHVSRLLVRLTADSDAVPQPGTKLNAGDKEVGWITSAAHSPAIGKVVALGYVRAVHAAEGKKLDADGVTVEVSGAKPA